jgi:hypothetical protein
MRRLSSSAVHGIVNCLDGSCFCGHFRVACGEASRVAAHIISSTSRKKSLTALMEAVGARDIALCKMEKNTRKKTLRQEATTSNFSSYPSPLHPTSDKTGKRTAPNTGKRKTNAALSFAKVSALGSVAWHEPKVAGYGGLAGGDGSVHEASQGVRAMWKRAETITDTVIACRIADHGRGGRAYLSKHNEEEWGAIQGVPRAA